MNNPIQINNLNPNEVSVILPDGTMETVSTGTYKYEIKEG